MKTYLFRFFLRRYILLFTSLFFFQGGIHASEKVSLQLMWQHQFQFAGYYAALEKGYYKEAGLDVTIKEFNNRINITQEVLDQKSDFGVGRPSLILEQLEGKEIYLLAAILQNSPHILLAKKRTDLKTVSQLKNKKIMLSDNTKSVTSLLAMLMAGGVSDSNYRKLPNSFNVQDLISGKTDAMAAYSSNEPYQLKKKGVPYTIFSPQDHGFGFYSDILFTSKLLQKRSPQKVERFYQASLKGWAYAFNHIEEIINLILEKYNTQNRSREALRFEAGELRKLALQPGTPLGTISESRLNQIVQVYRLLGEIKTKGKKIDYFNPKGENGVFKLTEKEKLFLIQHPVIKVHNELNWPPFNYSLNGKPTGYSIDYMNVLAQKIGIQIDYVSGEWGELLNKAFDRKIDVMLNIVKTPERLKHLLFTNSYFNNPNVIIAKESANITGINSLFEKRVSFPEGFFYEELFKSKFPKIERVPVLNILAGLKAIQFGKADATVGELAVIRHIIRDNLLTGLEVKGEFDTGDPEIEKLNIAVRKDWPELVSILKKAMASISVKENQKLKSKWLLNIEKEKSNLVLTSKEQNWVKTHPILTVGNEDDWAPFDFSQNGKARGYSIDYLRLLAKKAGLGLKFVNGYRWDQLLGKIKNKQIDLLPAIAKTDARDQYIDFTKHYMENPTVLVTRKLDSRIRSIDDMRGRRLVLVKGYYYVDKISKLFPDIDIVLANGFLEGLQLVMQNQADGFIGSGTVVNYTLKEHFISGLQVIGQSGIDDVDLFKIRMGVQKGNKTLQSILNKAIASVSKKEKTEIQENWFSVQDSAEVLRSPTLEKLNTDSMTAGRLVVYVLGVFVVLSGLTGLLVQILKQKNRSINFGSHGFRGLILSGLAVFVILVVLIGSLTLSRNRSQTLEGVEKTLVQILSIAEGRIGLWLSERKAAMVKLGYHPTLSNVTDEILNVTTEEDLLSSEALRKARSFFRGDKEVFRNIGFFIINRDFVNIGSMRDSNLGARNLIADHYPELLEKAFKGEVSFIPPIQSDVPLTFSLGNSKQNQKPPTLFFVGPIYNSKKGISAIFTLRVDPWTDLSQITKSLGLSKTGETYLFDNRGVLLSNSIFEYQLRQMGLIGRDEKSALNTILKDPGGNLLEGFSPLIPVDQQPLTQMAEKAIAQRNKQKSTAISVKYSHIDTDMKGYRDYRGVPVFGAWLWINELDIGVASEIDRSEALHTYSATRKMLLVVLGFTLLISVSAVLLVLILGERTRRELLLAKDTLEDKVVERTEELRQREKQFRTVFDQTLQLMAVLDIEGTILEVNQAAISFAGVEVDKLVSQPFWDGPWWRHSKTLQLKIKDAVAQAAMGNFVSFEVTNMDEKGETHIVDFSVTPVLDEEQQVSLLLPMGHDVTKIKEVENVKREADERNRLLLESAGEGIFGIDCQGISTFINTAGCQILGYQRDELLGVDIHKLIQPTQKDGKVDQTEAASMKNINSGKVSFKADNEILWKKDGSRINVEMTSTPIIKNNAKSGAVVTFRDITEKLKAEEKVRKSERLLSRALKLAKMGGWEYSVNGVGGKVHWTQEVYDIHGIEKDMIEKDPLRDWVSESIKCYQGDDAKKITEAFTKTLTDGTPYDMVLRFKPWNGEEIWVRATAEAEMKNGKVDKVIGLLSDVNKQKQLEEALTAEKAHLQTVLDTSPVGVVILVDGIIKFANPIIQEWFDLKLGDTAPQFYVNTADRDHIMDTLKKNGIIEGYELQMKGKHNAVKEMMVTYMSIQFENKEAVWGWVMDITDLKKADRELRIKFDDLSRFRKLAVGREMKMIELKEEINAVLKKLGQTPKYKIHKNQGKI